MKDPCAADLNARIAQAGMAVLIDRLGGSVVISQDDRDAIATKYGGSVGVKVEEIVKGRSFRFTLIPVTGKPEPSKPVS